MSTNPSMSMRQRLIDALAMLMVSALSISLLVYVGFGEAMRTYERFQIERLIGQGELFQDSIDSYLRPGLPIRQFAGFGNMAESILSSDSTVRSIGVIDATNQTIFEYGENAPLITGAGQALEGYGHEVWRVDDIVRTVLPLRNRFEGVGKLVLTMNMAEVHAQVATQFAPLVILGVAASAAFALFTFICEPWLRKRGTGLLRLGFALSFMIVAGALVYTLVSLYSTGLQVKTRSILAALGGRLDDVAQLNLDYNDFDGLYEVLADFKRLNPEMNRIAITINGVTFRDTDNTLIGKPWKLDQNTDEISIALNDPNAAQPIVLRTEILRSGVYWQVARAIKNFAALFLASVLFAGFFMELARVVQRHVVSRAEHGDGETSAEGKTPRTLSDLTTNSLVKPAFFLAVFIDSLFYPFLPQITFAAVRAYGMTGNYASLPFILYYLFFAAALIPAGRYGQLIGSRRLITLGLVLSGASYVMLAAGASFPTLLLARALAGGGQGLLFIGVQSFVLTNTSHDKRTQAAGIIVFGFQAGTLSGMAIGSLLISQIGLQGVCVLAGSVAALTALYVSTILPLGDSASDREAPRRRGNVFRDLLMMMRDNQVMRSMVFIGVPAKSIMTGVILFTLPLLLSKHGLANEDVGQITMGYAAAVLWASEVVARHADRNGGIKNILFLGALLSSAGLLAIGAGGNIEVPFWSMATIVAGVCLVGVAHGFINAPVVIHVSDAPVSTQLGAPVVAATYRLLERIGHVIGPGIMGQMLLVFGQDWSTVYWIAGGVAMLAFLFAATDNTTAPEFNVEMSK